MSSFRNLYQPTGRNLLIDNKSYLFFGGTAYLGLLDNPDYIALYKEGIDKYGLNNGTSRTNNIQLGVYDKVEHKMAERFSFESCAIFSSGYLAAQATVKALEEDREAIYAPASHPALWLGSNPNINQSFSDWSNDIVRYINASEQTKFIVISNCIDNLKPENYDFLVFEGLRDDKDVLFVLDDSHGLAVVNRNGISSDISPLKEKSNIRVVVVSSLAKGLGTDAGLVLGDRVDLNRIKSHPMFMGASPASPASMHALIEGEQIYNQAFDKLHANLDYFVSLLGTNHGLKHIDNFPVFTSDDPHLYRHLCKKNLLISSFPYPLPSSPLLNRIVISALHTEQDIEELANVLHAYVQ